MIKTFFSFSLLFLMFPKVVHCSQLKLDFGKTKFFHLTFDDIPATNYQISNNMITANVTKSSSIFFHPFKKIIDVNHVSFEYQSSGNFKKMSPDQEKTKDGDDAPIRIGLILKGDGAMVPFFAPAWIKKTKKELHFDTNKMIYIAGGLQSPPHSNWENPFSDSIMVRTAHCVKRSDSWYQCHSKFKKTQQVIGIWILADGDNTKSSFKTILKNLLLSGP